MATKVKLTVDVNHLEVINKLADIDKKATALSAKPYKLNFEVSGLDALQKTLNSISTSMAQFAGTNGGATQAIQQMGAAYKTVEIDADGAKKQINYFKDSVIQTRKVIQDGNRTITETTRDFSKLGKTNEEVGKTVKSLDDKFGSLTRKMSEYEGTGKYKQGVFDGLRTSAESYRAELENLYTAYQNDGDINKFTKGVGDLNDKYKELRTTLGETARDTDNLTKSQNLLGDSLGNIVAKIVAWQVINATVATVIRSFKQAVQAIKDVDTELTNIQKVTDATNAQMRKLGDTAFETASKYGVSANEYLQSAGVFAKAGFENYEALAEISTKTELVGDVTADVASQFLISASAAYDYKGNVEQLSKVLDAANVVENNFATSIEKIAEGLPIVASTASMANMPIEQLIAALGTITAVTQESGTKAATALRALILNIMGEVGAEIEDGVVVTEESIKSLDALLVKYAPDAVAAAKATGEIINPMEAINSLAKAAQEGLMTEAELADFLSSLGGKLRTNQLSALVNNWGMFEDMLGKIETSAGSADKEVTTMLGSWESKTKILENTWTKFISNFVNTDVVKGALDATIRTIDILDSGFGKFVGTVGLATLAMAGLGKAFAAIKGTALISTLVGIANGSEAAASALAFLNAELLASPLFWTAIGVGIVKLIDVLTVSFKEQQEIVAELNAEYETMFGEGSEYDTLIKKTEELTDAERIRLAVLKQQKEAAEETLRIEQQTEYEKFTKQNEYTRTYGGGIIRIDRGQSFLDRVAEIGNGFTGTATSYEDTVRQYRELLYAEQEYYDQLKKYQELGIELTDDQYLLIDAYEATSVMLDELEEQQEDTTDGFEKQKEAVESFTHSLEKANEKIKAVNDSMADGEKGDTADSFDEQFDKFLEQWTSGRKNTKFVNKFIETWTTDAQKAAANYNYSELGNELANGVLKAVFADEAGRGYIEAFAAYVNAHQAEIGNAIKVVETDSSYEIAYNSAVEVANALGLDVDLAIALLEALGAYSEPTGEIKEKVEDTTKSVEDLIEEAEKNKVELKANDKVTPVIDGISNKLRTFQREFGTITVNVNADTATRTVTANGNTYRSTIGRAGDARASGGISSGGRTLVNEAGPELISDNGTAYIANSGKPAIVNLGHGAIVLNAQQTAEALGTSGLTSSIKAYASGTVIKPSQNKAFSKEDGAFVQITTNKKSGNYAVSIPKTTSSSSSSSGGSKTTAVAVSEDKDTAMDALEKVLDNLDAQAELAEYQGNKQKVLETYARAQDEIAKTLDEYRRQGYADDSDEILKLSNLGYSYANKQLSYAEDIQDELWENLIDAIKALTEEEKDANSLAEKQLSVDKAREAYENAQKQRTVRIFNTATGQWEWVSDTSAIEKAAENLKSAEKSLRDEKISQGISALEKSRGNGVVIGTGLADVFAGKSEEDLQPLANAIQAYYGGVNTLGSTKPNSAFTNVQDSHDTVYTFPGGIKLTQAQAESTTLADLARQLQVLNIT